MHKEPFLFSVRTLAKRWGVSRSTVWRWSRDGRLPQPVKIGNCSRWTADQVQAFEQGLIDQLEAQAAGGIER